MIGGRIVKSHKMLCSAVVLSVSLLVTTGCGGVNSRGDLRQVHVGRLTETKLLIQNLPTGKYTSVGSWTLVKESISGGYVLIEGKRFRSGRRIYSTLAGRIEQVGKPMVGDRGFPLDISGSSVLQMAIYRGCAGSHLYALAYGLLSQPADLVT